MSVAEIVIKTIDCNPSRMGDKIYENLLDVGHRIQKFRCHMALTYWRVPVSANTHLTNCHCNGAFYQASVCIKF